MTLDLNKLENKLDEALSNETSQTLNKFLNDKRMTNNKQQTAVDILWDKVWTCCSSNLSWSECERLKKFKDQAKEMEKEQTINFTDDWYFNGPLLGEGIDVKNTIEQHYNQTYGDDKQ
jgi:uncharacterized coiled-coil protein SlyX